MRIEYELTKSDFEEFHKYHMAHSKIGRGARLFKYLLILVVVLGVLINEGIFRGGVTPVMWISLLLTVVLMGGIFLLMDALVGRNTAKKMANRLSKKDSHVLGWRSLEICEDGLMTVKPNAEGKTYWNGIDRVEENTGYIFVYLNAVAAHIVPKTAFADEKQEAEFMDILLQKAGKSHEN